MALPLSRNRTNAPGSQIFSADLNDLQDCIVGGKHGQITRRFGPSAITTTDPSLVPITIGSGYVQNTSGASSFICALSLPLGAVITGIRVGIDPASTNVLRAQLKVFDIAAGTEANSWFADTTVSGFAAVALATGGATKTVVVGENLAVTVTRQSGTVAVDRVFYIDVDCYMP